MNFEGCTALITGASAGLGEELARQLAPRARVLVLVARRQDRLEELRRDLTAQHPQLQVHLRATDLSRTEEVEALCAWLATEKIAIDFLVNNAGLGDRGAFATSAPQRVSDMLAVNVTALTLLTRKLVPAMIAAQRGAILNVSSSASFMPMPGLGVYAATKAYVTSFSEALRAEIRTSGVTVTALCPGPVHTEFDRVARRAEHPGLGLGPSFIYVSPEAVVRAALEGVEKNRAIVIPGVAMKAATSTIRLLPMAFLRFFGRFSR